MKAYKGFDKNMKCRDFQFEEGKEHTQGGKIKCCENGFHSVENPLDALLYYAPSESIYREVEVDGKTDRHDEDSKIASSKIKIGAEISIKSMVDAGVKFIFEKCDWSKKENHTNGDYGAASQTGDCGAASQTGYCGAASQTGYRGAASQTGYRGAASQTGDCGAASQTGDCGAASQTGDYGAASQTGNYGAASQTGNYGAASQTGDRGAALTTGAESASEIKNTDKVTSKNGTAISLGINSKVRAPIGCWLVCAQWDEKKENISEIITGLVDGKKLKADTWYTVKGGRFVRVK